MGLGMGRKRGEKGRKGKGEEDGRWVIPPLKKAWLRAYIGEH